MHTTTHHHTSGLISSLLLLSLFTNLLYVQADNDALNRLKGYARNVQAFNNLLPQEKVYLHFDNTSYVRGETIWFKAYVVRTDSARLTDLSRVLYVELVAPTGDIIQTRKLKIENGQARGEFKLDIPLIDNGWYEVRAYTRYMTNWDAAGIFSRVFPIFGKSAQQDCPKDSLQFVEFIRTEQEYTEKEAETKNRRKEQAMSNIRSIDFYPEGGHLVKGIPSRVAFMLNVRADKKKEGLTGMLLTASGDTLESMKTDNEGRGIFQYNPSMKPTHLAFREANGMVQKFKLPEMEESGCGIHVDAVEDNKNVHFTLRCTEDMEECLLGWTLLHEGNVLHFDTVRLSSTSDTEHSIPRNTLPAGVNQLTLFDREGRILAERLFFVHPVDGKDMEHISVISPDAIRPYGKMDFQLHTKPGRTFSFSVTDAQQRVETVNQGGVASWLLLSSDLKGFIRNPEHYLQSDDMEHRAATDRLMMVQGWRRYDWQTMAGKNSFIKRQPLEDGLYIDGQVQLKLGENAPEQVGLDLLLMNPQRKHQWVTAKEETQKEGWFAFRVEGEIEGKWNLIINTKETSENKEGQDYHVLLNRHFSPALRVLPWEEMRLMSPYCSPVRKDYTQPNKKKKEQSWKESSKIKNSLKEEAKLAANSLMYYDCEKAVEDLLDQGMDIPSVYDWLQQKPYIKYAQEVEGRHLIGENKDPGHALLSTQTQRVIDPIQLFSSSTPAGAKGKMEYLRSVYINIPDDKQKVKVNNNLPDYSDSYLMLDNGLLAKISDRRNMQPSYYSQPTSTITDEEKHKLERAVYATTFSKTDKLSKKQGIRQTYFQGYNRSETFHMNNYSEVEPVEDHRRTLYWNPDITTDSTGSATVTVWNSTSCREVYLSAEGITPEGKPMTGHNKDNIPQLSANTLH
ncbi:MAG: hypothetical protein K2N13_07350 [Paraprevotella sp.]|nr:hypothetical protein [Paraprevotella sp.]